ncbi:MAG: antibiotic biosynthesis monooxygenase [Ruminococcus sp.]|nr:antibiotic biosynthesis monooxygenase [Ruminococcus sp.]
MSLTVNLYYTGANGNARKFDDEMENSGVASAIRAEKGNLRYDYFIPVADSETVLLIDSLESQEALDAHHASLMMEQIAALREKYDLHISVERYISSGDDDHDSSWIRK